MLKICLETGWPTGPHVPNIPVNLTFIAGKNHFVQASGKEGRFFYGKR
jgi:hypothetical protein